MCSTPCYDFDKLEQQYNNTSSCITNLEILFVVVYIHLTSLSVSYFLLLVFCEKVGGDLNNSRQIGVDRSISFGIGYNYINTNELRGLDEPYACLFWFI